MEITVFCEVNIVFDCIIDYQSASVFRLSIVISCPIPNTSLVSHAYNLVLQVHGL